MRESDAGSHPAERLKKMLKAAGLRSTRLDQWSRGVSFPGRLREWMIVATLTPEWLHVSTAFCEVPQQPGLRERLYQHAMEQNRRMNLAKFSVLGNYVMLEADYRAEHVDATVLGNLVGFLVTVAQEEYPAVFRIASGDATLQALEASMSEAS